MDRGSSEKDISLEPSTVGPPDDLEDNNSNVSRAVFKMRDSMWPLISHFTPHCNRSFNSKSVPGTYDSDANSAYSHFPVLSTRFYSAS